MTTSAPPRPALLGLLASGAIPTAGAVAQTSLAADAAAVLQWRKLVAVNPGAAEVSATVDAIRRLRTDLRSLRPILDRNWSLRLRDALEPAQELLAAVLRLEDELRLLGEPTGEPVVAEVMERISAPREPLLAMASAAIHPTTLTTLEALAAGRVPAPLRTAAPIGEAHQPADFVLPAILHRAWRKILKETERNDLPMMEKRTQKFLVAAELANRGGLDVSRLVLVATQLLGYATAAVRADYAAQIRAELAPGPMQKRLTRLAKRGKAAARGINTTCAELAAMGEQLVTAAKAPPKSAAGGLVVRRSTAGPQVLLVHRIRHDDWSIPKGAAMPGEPPERCAAREVREETGLECRLDRELHNVTYRDRNGRPKLVRYWVMTPVEKVGEPAPDEIDDIRWVSLETAESLVSRKREKIVLRAYSGKRS